MVKWIYLFYVNKLFQWNKLVTCAGVCIGLYGGLKEIPL